MYIFLGTTFETPSVKFKPVEPLCSYFCRGGDEPKVHMPYQTTPGQIPRKLEIERSVLFVRVMYMTEAYTLSSVIWLSHGECFSNGVRPDSLVICK